ncbi:hypothetical protein BJY00DRAFT_310724 [Aspergillus carlsbadensis]|nr:hypothetical protein BJY00DRAFT_310724 [Aspergillus carlsbadensis]
MATDPESLRILDWTDPETERLFDKALNSLTTITQEEKHKIAEWIPSRIEMEARAQKYLGQSVDELIHLAATDTDSLTYPQFLMVSQGFHLIGGLNDVGRWLARSKRAREQPELQGKWERAREAVLSEVEMRAVLNLKDPSLQRRLQAEYFGPRDRAAKEARSRPAPWVQKVIDQDGGGKSWGFVIYCQSLDDSPEWQQFRRRFDEILSEIPVPALGTEEIRHTKVADLTHFEGQEGDFDGVRKNFRVLREQGPLKPGVLSNVVLYIDLDCRTSCDNYERYMYSWLWALDPDWPRDGPDEDGYDGKVPVNWAMAYDKFYNFISMGTFSLKDIWRDYQQLSLSGLIRDSRGEWLWIVSSTAIPASKV